MPELTVGTATGNRTVLDPWIGTDGGNRQVQEMWVGTPGGNRLVFNRSQPVVLTATPISTSRIDLSWTAANPSATYTVKRGASTIYTGTGLSKSDTGLAASTTYDYSVTAKVGNLTLSTDTASAKTLAPTITTKTVTLSPVTMGSYTGSGALRSTTEFWSGRYSSTWGRQQSAFVFAVPADVRWCVGITAVEVRAKNLHSYNDGGVTQSWALTHDPRAGDTMPLNTGPGNGRWTPRLGWFGQVEWTDITLFVDKYYKKSVAENFRTLGATGFCFMAPDDSIGHYSKWTSVQLRITYRVNTP